MICILRHISSSIHVIYYTNILYVSRILILIQADIVMSKTILFCYL